VEVLEQVDMVLRVCPQDKADSVLRVCHQDLLVDQVSHQDQDIVVVLGQEDQALEGQD
jgi:hypothetical protein